MADYMKYVNNAKNISKSILDGSENMQAQPVKTGAANKERGIAQSLATPSAAVALGQIAQAIAPDQFGGRLGAVGENLGKANLFQQGLKGGEISNLLSPEQQLTLQSKRDLDQQRKLERDQAIIDQNLKIAKFIQDIEANQLDQERSRAVIDNMLKELGVFDERFGMEKKAAEADINLTNAQIENLKSLDDYRQRSLALQSLGGSAKQSEIDRDLFGALIRKKYPEYIDLAEEAISGKSRPEDFIAEAFFSMEPDEYASLLNDMRNLQSSLGGSVPGEMQLFEPTADGKTSSKPLPRRQIDVNSLPAGLQTHKLADDRYLLTGLRGGNVVLSAEEYEEYKKRTK